MGILTPVKPSNRERESAYQVLRMDETETVVLSVCETMSQEDMILSQVPQEDMILSHVYIYVCVVSLMTKLFP